MRMVLEGILLEPQLLGPGVSCPTVYKEVLSFLLYLLSLPPCSWSEICLEGRTQSHTAIRLRGTWTPLTPAGHHPLSVGMLWGVFCGAVGLQLLKGAPIVLGLTRV